MLVRIEEILERCSNVYNYSDANGLVNKTVNALFPQKIECEVKTYTVTFNTNGGNDVSPKTNVKHGSTILEPAFPTKTGYDFAGWYKELELINE